VGQAAEVGITLGFAVLFAASSLYGYATVNACDAAQEARSRRIERDREPAPEPPAPPEGRPLEVEHNPF
jgi:hypothetical protein